MTMRWAWIVVLLPLVLACEGKAVTGTSTTYALTEAGGTFYGPSGFRLVLDPQPALASSAGITLTLSMVEESLVPPLAGQRRLSPGWYIETNAPGLTFNPPAVVELRYTRGQLSAEVRKRALSAQHCEGPYPSYLRENERPVRNWDTLPNGVADPLEMGSYQANTTQVGLFAVFAPEAIFGSDGDWDANEASEGEAETDGGESESGL